MKGFLQDFAVPEALSIVGITGEGSCSCGKPFCGVRELCTSI
jgi:hypothetical protein